MTHEIEIEFKNLLTEEEYQHFMEYFAKHPKKKINQKNHYFETKDFHLKQNHAALRIREKANKYVLTLKQPNPDGPGLLETHSSLTKEEAMSWIQGMIIPKSPVTEALNQLKTDIYSLKYGGMLQTERTEYEFKDITIVLDKSDYNNHTDYELELEASDEKVGWEAFQTLLNKHQIPKRKTMNKIERFYHTLKW